MGDAKEEAKHTQKEVREAEQFLESVEKKNEVINVEEDDDDPPEKKKRRKQSDSDSDQSAARGNPDIAQLNQGRAEYVNPGAVAVKMTQVVTEFLLMGTKVATPQAQVKIFLSKLYFITTNTQI